MRVYIILGIYSFIEVKRREILVVGQRRRNSMDDLKELGKLMKEHPIIIVVTLAAMAIGAILGAVAFYQGWLG